MNTLQQNKDYNILSTASRMLTPSIPDKIINTVSETIPNQSLTVTEVLQRFTNGTLPNIVQPVFHTDEDDFDNYDITDNPAFDLVDADNYINYIITKQEQIKNESNKKTKKTLTTENTKSDEQLKNNDELNDDDKK